jgi:hypothetical protein
MEQFIEQTLPISFVVEHLKRNVGKVKIDVVSGGKRSTVTRTLEVIGVCGYLDLLSTL